MFRLRYYCGDLGSVELAADRLCIEDEDTSVVAPGLFRASGVVWWFERAKRFLAISADLFEFSASKLLPLLAALLDWFAVEVWLLGRRVWVAGERSKAYWFIVDELSRLLGVPCERREATATIRFLTTFLTPFFFLSTGRMLFRTGYCIVPWFERGTWLLWSRLVPFEGGKRPFWIPPALLDDAIWLFGRIRLRCVWWLATRFCEELKVILRWPDKGACWGDLGVPNDGCLRPRDPVSPRLVWFLGAPPVRSPPLD